MRDPFKPEDSPITLEWNIPEDECENSSEISGYKVYYSNDFNGDFNLLFDIDSSIFNIKHLSTDYSGCYFILSYDKNGNESEHSDTICAVSCPLYILPNTFTPNGDGSNDIFTPIYKRHINKIEMKIYNKLGVLVYETTNPEINWDATDSKGNLLDADTYYYICTPIIPMVTKTLSGYIEVIY
ncbi:MAG: gliding motility-associated C-terminal domain-containing protein [Saprospiraceae bacterium]